MQRRHRLTYAIGIAATIVLGLTSRMKSLGLPSLIFDHGGDVLSATCILFGVRFWWDRGPGWKIGALAFGICVAIETQQLYQAPWAVRVRNNRIAGTLLGHGFLWIDLLRYFVGVVLGMVLMQGIDDALSPNERARS